MTSGRGVGSPSEPVVKPVGETRDAAWFTFQVRTPAVSLAQTSEGSYTIKVESFGAQNLRPGAPDLPTRIIRVAIPPGVVPRLEVRVDAEDFRPGVRPEPVARRVPDLEAGPEAPGAALHPEGLPRAREVRVEDPALYAPGELHPSAVAWLGPVGVFRDQRYVEVHLAPVRFDPAAGGVRVARSFDVTVRFDGDTLARFEPRPDPHFEAVYQKAFVNYEQGTSFRIGSAPAGSLSESPSPVLAASRAAANATPRYRIRVRANGIIRLDYARMAATGFLAYNLSSWKLTSNGVEVPLLVHDPNGNDLLDNNPANPEWVEFYGQALDFDPKTTLNTDNGDPTTNLYEAADFTDENIYFLTVETGARSRLPGRPSAPLGVTPASDFPAVSHQEQDSQWLPIGQYDPWYWKPTFTAPQSRTDAVPLPGLASGTLPAEVIVRLRGWSTFPQYPDHHSRVTLQYDAIDGDNLAQQDDNGTFDGVMIYTHDFTWTYPGSGPVLQDPAYVKSEAITISGIQNSMTLDFVEIHYRRSFTATGDTLTFDYPNGNAEFQITGFQSGPTSPPEVWEITGKVGGTGIVGPVRLTGASVTGIGPYTVRFNVPQDPSIPAGTSRRFVVTGDAGVSIPADPDFTPDTVSDLLNNTNQADLIVISRPDILGPLATPVLNQLLSLRLAQQGITSKVVMLQDVQDEFNNGLYGPTAIKNFLAWVMSTNPGQGWASPKPAYVLLIGDGSYDYKHNDTTTGVTDFVPTEILLKTDFQLAYLASDNDMAAVVGTDHLADLLVGRITARSDSEAQGVLQKIYNYESTTAPGNWTRHALFVSDRGHTVNGVIDASDSLDFEATNNQASSYMKEPPYSDQKLRYYSDYCDLVTNLCNFTKMTADIKGAVNGAAGFPDGAAVLQYVGHGNYFVWSDDSIFDEGFQRLDVNDLTNASKLPWLIGLNCLTGGFHTTKSASMEDWQRSASGGAISVFAPSGLTFSTAHHTITDIVWGDLFGSHKERVVAVPVMDTLSELCLLNDSEGCQGMILLGDPAQRLALKSVAPATGLTATGGNAVVNLSWVASTTAGVITYDVYRSQNLANGYTRIETGQTATTYQDTGVVNATTYYYYVVAVDAEGFESRWSNFNSDCSTSGPDCVQATPLNPNPPNPPTGLTVTDPGTSGRLDLTWNANSETDLKNYTIWYGTASHNYTQSVNAGKSTSYELTGLQNGVTYYIALTATNTSGKTSGYSAEGQGTPTFVRGVRSPEFITSLVLAKSGSDLVLSWSAVTTDIYGKPTTIANYEVYRGTTVSFIPSASTRIGTPVGTTFTDLGALAASTPTYYYLVRAVDTSNNVGGLGYELPNGIDTLLATKSSTTPGNVTLSWPAVTTDFDGGPTRIDHYDVYYADHPFSRANIRDGTVSTKFGPITGTSYDFTPSAATQYYSVIVVDTRGNLSSF